ncbi:MAG: hypothetical protein ACE5HI_01880 [bacterium]
MNSNEPQQMETTQRIERLKKYPLDLLIWWKDMLIIGITKNK